MQNNRSATFSEVMTALGNRQDEISNMLPPDLPIDRFKANVVNALHSNPQILDCTSRSIVQSCMKAAYDGLRLDGREAALVVHETTYNRGKESERKVKEAQYFPMVFGLIQQVYRGGEVVSMFADVIREHDQYEVRRGTAPGIMHVPNINAATRGAIIAAYSVATLKSGHVTFEILDRADLADIKGAAKTKAVWDRWGGEMSKKSAVRRHRKTLPIGERDIVLRDSEADELYEGIDPGRENLPAPSQSRPTRAAIADQAGTESGAPMDLGSEEDVTVIDQKPADQRSGNGDQPDRQRTAAPREEISGVDLPNGEDEWAGWAADIEAQITSASDAEAINRIAKDEEVRIGAASKERRDFIKSLITDRLTDFATAGEVK